MPDEPTIELFHNRLDNWEWNDGDYVVITVNSPEEAVRVEKVIKLAIQFPNLKTFFERARTVSENYKKAKKIWNITTQFAKIDEELQELKDAENDLQALEEGFDVIFAVIRLWHLRGYEDEVILNSLEATLRKIEKRSIEALHG